jgi:hypothetical protein
MADRHGSNGPVTLPVHPHRIRQADQRAAGLLAGQLRGIQQPGGRQ